MENTSRMTDRDIRLMIQLRANNADIFTGRRNSAMRGWRAIRKAMGVQGGALSAQQLKKKWDNLKDKYRALKNPPAGMEAVTQPSSWRWFHLMDEAMSGRLAGTAPIIQLSPLNEDEEHGAPPPLILPKTEAAFSGLSVAEPGPVGDAGMLGDVLEARASAGSESSAESPAEDVAATGGGDQLRSSECEPARMESQNQTAVLYATLLPDCTFQTNKTPFSSCRPTVREGGELDKKLVELQREWQALEREQAEFDRELIALERDRELLDRDRTAIERDRAAVERDRVVLERDRAFLERDRAFVDRDRVFLERAREDLERERALLRREREGTAVDGHQAEMTTEKEVVLQTRFYQRLMAADLDPEQLGTRQRLVSLFQRLVEKL